MNGMIEASSFMLTYVIRVRVLLALSNLTLHYEMANNDII